MARLHDEAISVVQNIKVYRAFRDNMLALLRELARIHARGSICERLHNEIERLTSEFIDLRGDLEPATVNTECHDILEDGSQVICRAGVEGIILVLRTCQVFAVVCFSILFPRPPQLTFYYALGKLPCLLSAGYLPGLLLGLYRPIEDPCGSKGRKNLSSGF